jgi:hypothetical protein
MLQDIINMCVKILTIYYSVWLKQTTTIFTQKQKYLASFYNTFNNYNLRVEVGSLVKDS